MHPELERFDGLDTDIAAVAKKIRVLGHLTWPEEVKTAFLEAWRAGRPTVPEVEPVPVDKTAEIEALQALMARCDRSHPIGNQLWKTAWSYATAGRMLGAIGTPEFTMYSTSLYGRPDHVYERQGLSALDAAEPIIETTAELMSDSVVPHAKATTPAEEFGRRLQVSLDQFFTEDQVLVVIDPAMSAKAAAGSKRVKLRADALFSDHDFQQLLNHEALIHTLTLLNGKRQPLRSLGLGAPRTTKTQEGLAVFSELATFSIDVNRLRRVALRSQAVAMALDGADLLDVFRFFLEAGQSEEESYHSAQRVFRGGDARGSAIFTKDGAYLEGLILVHTFLRKAISDGRPELIPHLFAGRMTLGDIVELEELFVSGVLQEPTYLPPWAVALDRLAANLSYSLFTGRIRLDLVALERFRELDEVVTE